MVLNSVEKIVLFIVEDRKIYKNVKLWVGREYNMF